MRKVHPRTAKNGLEIAIFFLALLRASRIRASVPKVRDFHCDPLPPFCWGAIYDSRTTLQQQTKQQNFVNKTKQQKKKPKFCCYDVSLMAGSSSNV
jgi:hypothetical protein